MVKGITRQVVVVKGGDPAMFEQAIFLVRDDVLAQGGVTEEALLEEARKAACDAVRQLGQDVGIPANLKEIVKEEDIQFLSESAYADACRPGNPRDTSVEEIAALYRSLI